jgi:general secretion pathway protein C
VGATLRAVYRDGVILYRGGNLETLRLPTDDAGQDIGRRLGQINGRGALDVQLSPEAGELHEQVLADPERITDIIRPAPYHVDGEMIGFRVFPGRMREIFNELGLRPGDIVTAVNGQALDSPAAGMRLLNELEGVSEVELTVRRGDEEISVNLSLASR